jgi:hypothetical protein
MKTKRGTSRPRESAVAGQTGNTFYAKGMDSWQLRMIVVCELVVALSCALWVQ